MSDEIKTLIVDDHPIFRKGLRQVIESDAKLKVIGEAENGISALELIENLKPDVVVADVNMPQMGGLELARKIREKSAGRARLSDDAQRRNDVQRGDGRGRLRLRFEGKRCDGHHRLHQGGCWRKALHHARIKRFSFQPQPKKLRVQRANRRLGFFDKNRTPRFAIDCRRQNEQANRRDAFHPRAHG